MRFSEDELRKITLNAIEELGEKASPDLVKKVISRAVSSQVSNDMKPAGNPATEGRAILTAFGMNKPGIVAAITNEISKYECDIQDLTQKLMDDFFTMIMILDISTSNLDFAQIQENMSRLADEMKIKVYLQHEDIFRAMHRI